jgi:hypothetical protein
LGILAAERVSKAKQQRDNSSSSYMGWDYSSKCWGEDDNEILLLFRNLDEPFSTPAASGAGKCELENIIRDMGNGLIQWNDDEMTKNEDFVEIYPTPSFCLGPMGMCCFGGQRFSYTITKLVRSSSFIWAGAFALYSYLLRRRWGINMISSRAFTTTC